MIIAWERESERAWQRGGKQKSNVKMPNKKKQTTENYKLENYFQSYFIQHLFGYLMSYVSTL